MSTASIMYPGKLIEREQQDLPSIHPFPKDESDRIQALLDRKLTSEHISTRAGAGGYKVHYLQGSDAIELANFIFKYNGWSTKIVDLKVDFSESLPNNKYSCCCTAIVRVTLQDGASHEDIGTGSCIHTDRVAAIDKSKKEAVTDAMKRALRLYGNGLGNSLYDKDYLQQLNNGTIAPEPLDMNRNSKRYKSDTNNQSNSLNSNNHNTTTTTRPNSTINGNTSTSIHSHSLQFKPPNTVSTANNFNHTQPQTQRLGISLIDESLDAEL